MNLFGDEPEEDRGAIISECGMYRYHLWRVWDKDLLCLVWVMQNPSTANATDDDPTIRKCIAIARHHGYGGISVRNVFALRATDERELLKHTDPVGPENEQHLLAARSIAPMTRLVLAWGNRFGGKALAHHYQNAANILGGLEPYCLGTTAAGEPLHPLFQKNKADLVRYMPLRKDGAK